MKIYIVGHDEKCGGCNWQASTVYFAADSQKIADEMWQENEAGLCADCLIELFQELSYDISPPHDRI